MHCWQLELNGTEMSVDDSRIAWPSDINYKFVDAVPTNFNTEPALRGGGTLNGTLKVSQHHKVLPLAGLHRCLEQQACVVKNLQLWQ
jgi:hypothetical protein